MRTVNPEGARVFAQGPHCTAIQYWMNMGTDMPEMLAVCDEYDQASIIRSPLGSGNMTGKFNSDTVFPKDDMRSTWDLRSEAGAKACLRLYEYQINLLTVQEVADWAKVSTKTVYRWIADNKILAIRLGNRTYRIPEKAIIDYLKKISYDHLVP